MNNLRKLANKPIIGPLVKKAMDYAVNKKVSAIAKHFSTFLDPIVADSTELKSNVFGIRHQVYCEELKFESENAAKHEIDEFDKHSIHCLIRHNRSEKFAGTVRVVAPQNANEKIPIQKYCLNSITPGKINPNDFPPQDICEISRLAVPSEFRKRATDAFKGSATGAINKSVYSEDELRCFPFIAIGLYFSSAALIEQRNIKHIFVMMEPRLARSMSFVGIRFEQIGPIIEYHGKRAPYYINPNMFYESLTPGFKILLRSIQNSLWT